MATTIQPRRPRGAPTGGEFDVVRRAQTDVDLTTGSGVDQQELASLAETSLRLAFEMRAKSWLDSGEAGMSLYGLSVGYAENAAVFLDPSDLTTVRSALLYDTTGSSDLSPAAMQRALERARAAVAHLPAPSDADLLLAAQTQLARAQASARNAVATAEDAEGPYYRSLASAQTHGALTLLHRGDRTQASLDALSGGTQAPEVFNATVTSNLRPYSGPPGLDRSGAMDAPELLMDTDGSPLHRARPGVYPDVPYRIAICADRDLSDADMKSMAQAIGYAYRAGVRGEPLGWPERLSPRAFVVPVDATKTDSDDLGVAMERFESSVGDIVVNGSPVRKSNRYGAGTAGTRLVEPVGPIAFALYYDSVVRD